MQQVIQPRNYVQNIFSTLLGSGGGGFQAQIIGLLAVMKKLFHLDLPNFVTLVYIQWRVDRRTR